MSYIYFDINGRLREYVTTPKRKGSENVDTLCVYWEGNDGTVVLPSQCFIEYGHENIHAGPLTANKISRTIIPFERERDLRFFQYGKTYQFMCFDLPTAVSSTSGFWHSSVSIHDRLSNNVVQVLGDITFEIEESSIVPSGNLDLSQYNYILDKIKGIEGNLDSKLDKTTPASIIDGNGDKVVDFASDKVTIHKKAQSIEIPVEAKDIANKEYVDSKVSTETEGMVKVGDLKTLNGESLLGSGDIAYDASLSSTSINAVQNKVINSTISDLSYQLAMVRENLFQTVLSEIDYTEDFATLYPIPDTLSDTDGTHRVLFSETQLREVAGNSVVLNQHLHNEITSYGTEGHEYGNGSTLSIDNGKMTITSTGANQSYFGVGFGDLSSLQNHKVLCIAYISSISVANSFKDISFSWGLLNTSDEAKPTSSNKYVYSLGTWDSNKTATYLNINGTTTVEGDYIVVDNYMIIDLTQMFGAGNEPTTVAEFKRLFPEQYYEYSTGEIRNTTASGVKVNGYNLLNLERTEGDTTGWKFENTEKRVFDETKYYVGMSANNYWSSTSVNDYSVTGNSVMVNAKNGYGVGFPIRVFPGKTYKVEFTATDGTHQYRIGWYDRDGSLISFSLDENKNKVAPDNAYWGLLVLSPTTSNTNVTFSNICFHLSTLRTGYAPYKEPKAISFASTELLGAGEVHDTIEVVEGNVVAGIQRYNLVHVKRIGTVDLGTLGWTYYGDTEKFFLSNGIANLIKPIEHNEVVANLVCSKYRTNYFNSILQEGTDKIIAQTTSNQLVEVKDSSYTDATAFKAAMNGVILNYELATPTRTTIAENLTFEEVSATIEQGGSIETIYETLAPNCTTGFVVKKATEVSK